jgi:hypothetical protein
VKKRRIKKQRRQMGIKVVQPTPKQIAEVDKLLAWHRASKKSNFIVGGN